MAHRELFGATPTIALIHVVPDLLKLVTPGHVGRAVASGLKPEQAEAMQRPAFENAMAPARKLLARAGMPFTEGRLFGNNAGDQVAAYATQNKLDLLAMGSHGHGALEPAVLGSVAARVVALCRTALLLVREK